LIKGRLRREGLLGRRAPIRVGEGRRRGLGEGRRRRCIWILGERRGIDFGEGREGGVSETHLARDDDFLGSLLL
jgi:hypothetical protein